MQSDFAHSSGILFSTFTPGMLIDWNKGPEKIKGYARDEIIGKSFRLFYTKEDKDSDLPGNLLKLAVEKGSVNHDVGELEKMPLKKTETIL